MVIQADPNPVQRASQMDPKGRYSYWYSVEGATISASAWASNARLTFTLLGQTTYTVTVPPRPNCSARVQISITGGVDAYASVEINGVAQLDFLATYVAQSAGLFTNTLCGTSTPDTKAVSAGVPKEVAITLGDKTSIVKLQVAGVPQQDANLLLPPCIVDLPADSPIVFIVSSVAKLSAVADGTGGSATATLGIAPVVTAAPYYKCNPPPPVEHFSPAEVVEGGGIPHTVSRPPASDDGDEKTLIPEGPSTEPGKPTCESLQRTTCKKLRDEEGYRYDSMQAAKDALENACSREDGETITLRKARNDPTTTTSGPCPGAGQHYSMFDQYGEKRGSIVGCPCCVDTESGPITRWVWAVRKRRKRRGN